VKFAKVLNHARPPVRLNPNDPGLTIFSAEDFKVEHGEVHAYRTGVVLDVPEGYLGMFVETQSMGFKGVTVAGGVLSPNDISEVRVALINSHREAYEIKSGMPLAQIILLKNDDKDDDAEEVDREELTEELQKRRDAAMKEQKVRSAKRGVDAAKENLELAEKKAKGVTTEGGRPKPNPVPPSNPPKP